MNRTITRACFCFVLMAFLACAGAAQAAPAKTPTETIQGAVQDILNIIKNPDMHDAAKRPALLKQVEDIAYTVFDFDEFSALTVGVAWRSFTPDQKKRFTDAFASLLRAQYVEKLDGYDGQKVEYLGEVPNARGNRIVVQTRLQLKDKIIPVSYGMVAEGNEWKIFDVTIEEMSLVLTYRNQFKEVAATHDADALIALVESKAAQIRKDNEAGKRQ